MHRKHYIEVTLRHGVYEHYHEIQVDQDGNHTITPWRVAQRFNTPYRDEILLNGEVITPEQASTYILQDGDVVEGRHTPEGNAARAERIHQEEERLKNRPLKEKIGDFVGGVIEAIFNPMGL